MFLQWIIVTLGNAAFYPHSILNDRRSSLSRVCEFFSQTDLQLFPCQTWVIWSRGRAISEGRRWPRLSFTHLSPLPVLLHSLVWNDNCSFLHGEAEQYVQKCKKESEYFQSIKPYDHMKVGSLHALHFSPGCEQLARLWTFAEKKKIPSITEFVSDMWWNDGIHH